MSCAVCGVPTAGGVLRCALHRRPAFYAGRLSAEACAARGSLDATLPGDHRPPAPRRALPPAAVLVVARLEALGEAGATAADLACACRIEKQTIVATLGLLRRDGRAFCDDSIGSGGRRVTRWFARPPELPTIAEQVRGALAGRGPRTADEIATELGAPLDVVRTSLCRFARERKVLRTMRQTPTGHRAAYQAIGGAA